MKISYDISESEFFAAYESFWRANKQGSKIAFLFGFAGMAFGIFAYTVLTNFRPLSVALIAVAALLALFPLLRRLLYRHAYRANPRFHGLITSDFHEGGISTENEFGSGELKWGIYTRAFETGDAFLLSFSKYGFSIIPKRAFQPEGLLDEFRKLVENQIGEIKKI